MQKPHRHLPENHQARVVPIHDSDPDAWQGDLLRHLAKQPRHLEWLINRPVIRQFTDEVLIEQMIQAHADEVAIYHSPFRFEVTFRERGRRHLINVPNQRWAMPIVRRLMHLAGMEMTDHEAWQLGEITIGDLTVAAWHYPSQISERLVLRPRWGQAINGDPLRIPPREQRVSFL